MTIELVAIIGSLRAESVNRHVFEAARELTPDGTTLTEASVRELPLFDGDVEAAGDPDEVVALRASVEAADGLIFFTPEYNLSIPAVTKNAIDWLSRVVGDSALSRATVGVVAASPGRRAGVGVRAHLNDSLSLITGHLFEDMVGIGGVGDLMTDGRLDDVETRKMLSDWLGRFIDFIEENK